MQEASQTKSMTDTSKTQIQVVSNDYEVKK